MEKNNNNFGSQLDLVDNPHPYDTMILTIDLQLQFHLFN